MLLNSQQVKWSSSGTESHKKTSYFDFFPKPGENGRKCQVGLWMLFRALVTPCIPHCEPVHCGKEGKASYGRRKRREDETQGGGGGGWTHRMKRETSGDDILLANAIHILDKLQFLPGEGEEGEGEGEEGEGGCNSGRAQLLPISVVAAVFLLMQAIILFVSLDLSWICLFCTFSSLHRFIICRQVFCWPGEPCATRALKLLLWRETTLTLLPPAST